MFVQHVCNIWQLTFATTPPPWEQEVTHHPQSLLIQGKLSKLLFEGMDH